MQRTLTALMLAVAVLAAPAAALAQSAGDDQYVDPFQGDDGGGQQGAQEPQPEQPAPPGEDAGQVVGQQAAPAQEAAPEQEAAPTLPRTGLPVLLLASAGYALLLAGIAIRRQT